MGEQTANNQQQTANQQQQQQGVTLTQEQYQQVLSSLDELDKLKQSSKESENSEVDELVNRARSPIQGLSELDWDNMRPAEMVKKLEENFTNNGLAPIATAIEGLKIQMEVDRLTRDGKHDDFFTLEKDIYKIASENPRLSIKQAYDLARTQKAGDLANNASNDKSQSNDTRQGNENPLRHLPRLPQQQPHGEKPGGATPITLEKRTMSTREAAIKAFEEKVEGKTKET